VKICPHIGTLASGGRHLLRFSFYQASATATEVIFPAHVDFGLLTAYIGGSAPGLQGAINGHFVDIDNPPGSIILGAGTTLRMYDPQITPFRHQVVGGQTERLSVVFFSEPRSEVVLPNGLMAGEHLRGIVASIRKE
jgi:isopenicillin N synthase-like dioxygenase